MGVSDIETLRGLVDSSLRSPEYGIVNFHHLHKVLHGILSHLGLHYDGKQLASNETSEKNSQFSAIESDEGKRVGDAENYVERSENVVDIQQESKQSHGDGVEPKETNQEGQEVEKLKSHQRHLESKISNLEDKLKLLDEFPSNKTIIQEAQQSTPPDAKESTLSGIWQFMKINRRLQAAEDAIDRIMSILNEFLGSGQGKSLNAISDSIQDLSSELQQLKDQLKDSPSQFDGLLKREDLNKCIDGLATKDELQEYVKWPALEEALQIKKDKNKENSSKEVNIMNLDDQKEEKEGERPKTSPAPPTQTPVPLSEVPKTAMTTEGAQETAKDVILDDKKDHEEEAKIISDDSKHDQDDDKNTHPSPELVECLRRISELHDQHNKMSEVIETKMDKVNLVIPPDLQDQLDELKKGFETLLQNGAQANTDPQGIKNVALDNKDKIDTLRRELAALSRQAKQTYIERPPAPPPAIDNEALLAIQRKLTDLETNQDSSNDITEKKIAELLENLSNKQNLIEALYKQIQTLHDIKADKENVAIEMDYKADKAALESKVNTSTFDTTFTMLDEGLREALQKMDDYLNEELALKNALKQLSCDMKEKMDNEAFKAMQNYLEKRIADVQKSRTMIAREANVDLNNAAGLRRPLVNFHCISCNRPVDVKYNSNVEPSLPKADSIHIKKSKGPYLSYEIDQLRHIHRGQQPLLRPDHRLTSDTFSMSRPCGGSHTVTSQQLRKPVRIHNAQAAHSVNGSSREEPVTYPNWTREVSIIDVLKGTDGHVYKGRYRTIPPIVKAKGHKHTPSESDLPPLRNDPSPPLTGHKWSSEPELSRPRDEVELGEVKQSTYINTSKPLTPPTTTNASPNSRYKRVLSQRQSDLGSSAIPSPSPPTARENEYQRRIDREEFLEKQQQELADERLFSPRKEYRGVQPRTSENDSMGETVENMYSPHSPKLTLLTKSGGNSQNVIGLDLTKRQMSVDSVDDVMS